MTEDISVWNFYLIAKFGNRKQNCHVKFQYRRLYPTNFVSSDQSFGLITTYLYFFLINFLSFVLFEIEHLLIHGYICKKGLFQKVFFKINLWNSTFFAKLSLNKHQTSNTFSNWFLFPFIVTNYTIEKTING